MKNVVLIGMPGAEKRTIGGLLAKTINYRFIDSYLISQNSDGRMLYEIINQDGIDEFLKLEDRIVSEINVTNTVIATGGSVIFGENAMKHLKEIACVIYIKLDCEEIVRRVKNIKTRGIAMNKGETIKDVYNCRVPLYEKYADIVVDCNNLNVEDSVEKIYKSLKQIL